MHRPNFFLVGAMKSGSSSLTHYLHSHPDIFMTMRPKEPSFFVDHAVLKKVYPAMERLELWKSESLYLELFRDAGNARYIGDASQNYARLPLVKGVPDRIASFCPDAKILYIVRDPTERAISHYWYMVNFYGENRAILDAIKEDSDYTSTSHYAMQIAPYIELFGARNVKVIVTEELQKMPDQVMKEVFSWLEIDDKFLLPARKIRSNPTPKIINQAKGKGLLHSFRHSAAWSLIEDFVPKGIKGIGTKLSEHAIDRTKVSTNEIEAYLFDIQKNQVDELAALTSRSYEAWTRFR